MTTNDVRLAAGAVGMLSIIYSVKSESLDEHGKEQEIEEVWTGREGRGEAEPRDENEGELRYEQA